MICWPGSPSSPRGSDALHEIVRAVAPLPLIAIGGIDLQSAATLARAGAAGIAVISAAASADDPRLAVRELAQAFANGEA